MKTSPAKFSNWARGELGDFCPLVRVPLKILAFALTFPITALTIAVALTWLPCRLFVTLLARFFRPDLVGILRGSYSILFATSPEEQGPVAMCMFTILQGSLSVDELRARFRERILSVSRPDGGGWDYERFCRRPTRFLGYYFLKRLSSLDLNHHIRSYDYQGSGLGLPSGRPVVESDLEEITPVLCTMPWPAEHSEWEMLIIENFKSDDGSSHGNRTADQSSVMIVRWNHTLSDGYGMLSIICKLTDDPEAEQVLERLEQSTSGKCLQSRVFSVVRTHAQMMWDAADTLVVFLATFRGEWALKRQREPRVIITALSPGIPVEKIKLIRKEFNVKYASVLFTVLAAALRRMVADSEERSPPAISVVFPVPKPGHPGRLTNHFYGAIMLLPLGSIVDARGALRVVDERFSKASGPSVRITDFWLSLLLSLPVPLIHFLCSRARPGMGIGVMPAISRKGSICGKLVVDLHPYIVALAPPAMNGITVSLFGANGVQRVGVTVARSLFRHPEILRHLSAYIEEEVERLCAAEDRYSLEEPE